MNIFLTISIIIFIVAVFLFIKHYIYMQKIYDLVKNGNSTQAEIIALYIKEAHPDPTFGYGLQSGEALLHYKINQQDYEVSYTIDRDLSEEIAHLKLNDFVEILYDVNKPKKIILKAEQYNQNLALTQQSLVIFLVMSVLLILTVVGLMLMS
jgi:hypothetical protein